MGATPVGIGGGIVWVELNGLGEVGDGAVEIKRLEMRGPPTEVRGGIIGVGFKCFGVIRDGAVNLLLLIPILLPASVTDREGATANVSILIPPVSALATDDAKVCQCEYGSLGVINLENAHNGLRFRIRDRPAGSETPAKISIHRYPGLLHPFVWSAQACARGAGVFACRSSCMS